MQERSDTTNEEVDWVLQRNRALVESVENWRKSSSRSGISAGARRRSHGSSSWVLNGEDGILNISSEQPPEETGGGGSMKLDGNLPVMSTSREFERPTTRAGSRNMFMRQGSRHAGEGGLAGTELGAGCSQDTQDVIDASTNLQLGCGSSSSLSITNLSKEKVAESERKDIAGKGVCDAPDEEADLLMVPSSQEPEESRQNCGAEAEGSQGRRTRLGKQVEVDESDDEGSRPDTLLCLGTHPSRSSRLGSSSRPVGASGNVEAGSRPGFEGAPFKGKRKRDVDRSESAAAVGIALENAESESDDQSQTGRSTRRLIIGPPTMSSSLRDRRRTAERECDSVFPLSLLDSPPRGRPLLRRNLSGVSLQLRPSTQPFVLDLEQPAGAEGDGAEENDQVQNWRLGREEFPPTTTNATLDESPARYRSAQIIDLISPEPEHLYRNRIIDLVSPERSPVSGSTNLSSREEFAARHRRAARRDRVRWTRGVSERPRPSTGRHQRTANGAGSSQETPNGTNTPANEQAETESSRRRTEPSQPYFLRSGPRGPLYSDDVRILEETFVHNQPAAGNYRRRGRRFFPGADMPSSGGHPTISGNRVLSPDLSSILNDDIFCYPLDYLSFDSDDDDNTGRSRQLAEDERMARQLQAAFVSEAAGGEVPDDESLARRLQAEEDNLARDFRHTRSGDLFGLSAVQRYLGDLQSLQRESPPRFLRHARPRSDTSAYSSSSSRFNFPTGPRNGRYFQLHRGQQDMDAELPGGRVQFPSHMTMESRLEVLAALENAIQEQVSVGFQLAQVDRDFNENDYEMLLALDTDIDRNRGASLEKIALLPVTTLQPTDVCEDTCSICLEMQVAGEVVRRLPCIHVFHMKCIDKWLQRQAVCPVCKAHI